VAAAGSQKIGARSPLPCVNDGIRAKVQSGMHSEFAACFVLVLALGCGTQSRAPAAAPAEPASAPAKPDVPPTPSKSEEPMQSDDLRVLLPHDQVNAYFRMRGGNEKPRSHFTPTAGEIEKLEAGLPAMLREQVKSPRIGPPPLWKRAPKFMRQYIAFVDADGQRWIWANFMCDNPGPPGSDAWRKKIVSVDDGGDCFFNFEWSPDSGAYRRLEVNGDA
jgi:hypothetical protein